MGGAYAYQPQQQQPHHHQQDYVLGNAPNSAATASTQYFSPANESYASHYTGGQHPSQPVAAAPLANPYADEDDMEDAYGGYEHTPPGVKPSPGAASLPNPFEAVESSNGHASGGGGGGSRESRGSEYSQEDEEPRRVLKVANAD